MKLLVGELAAKVRVSWTAEEFKADAQYLPSSGASAEGLKDWRAMLVFCG